VGVRVLGIETSCDETAVAYVEHKDGSCRMLGSLVSSQTELHSTYGGVVPELATREHLRNLPTLVQQLKNVTGLGWREVDAVAVTEGPGLAPALLIGHSYARGLGLALNRPVLGVNHLEGHLFSPFLASGQKVEFPFIGLIVSGGHTLLVEARDWNQYRKLGGTVDDAAGEAFDKVARMLGLPYPGGPEIELMARAGNSEAYAFPRSFPERDNYNFSFSGLKTSVKYFVEKNPGALQDPSWVADICASFQEAVVQVLVRKTVLAAEARRIKRVVAAGGVLCNQRLRAELSRMMLGANIQLLLADNMLCTDNAAMIASVAAEKIHHNLQDNSPRDISPSLSLAED
jgi:N6-L-threonylcarbamoyladenine synthase